MKPIDWDSYRFLPRRKVKRVPKNINCMFSIPSTTFERIRKLSEKESISMSAALLTLLNTKESEAIEPTPKFLTGEHRINLNTNGSYILSRLLNKGKRK
jgi:hypothetical protein